MGSENSVLGIPQTGWNLHGYCDTVHTLYIPCHLGTYTLAIVSKGERRSKRPSSAAYACEACKRLWKVEDEPVLRSRVHGDSHLRKPLALMSMCNYN